MIYGGDGLSRLPADASGRGKAAFVPFVLAGEEVEATIVEQKPGFVRATAGSILTSSPHRVKPGCPYFGRCGGCQYQHSSYEHQLEIKKQILQETLKRTAKLEVLVEIEVHPSPPWNYRNRSRLQVQTEPEFALGYFKMSSHELLPVEECPISSPLINKCIAEVWHSGRSGCVPKGVREIEFFANAEDSQLLIEVSTDAGARRANLRQWAEYLRASMAEVAGVVAFHESERGGSSVEKMLTSGVDHLIYRVGTAQYRVSAGSFFQTNRHLVDELVRLVTAEQSGELAYDLYSGVGLFSTALAGDIRHIVSVESSQTSTADLSYNLPSNGEAVRATTEQYLARAENSERVGKGIVLTHNVHTPDLAVVDPPRFGLGERVARMLVTLGAPRVIYVSCDPATLARDLAVLTGSGYRIERVHLVDLFPQTFHIETVVHLVR